MTTLRSRLLGVSALALLAGVASAQTFVDGVRGAEWTGITPDHVAYNAAATNGFDTTSNTSALDVYFRSDATYVYGLIETEPAGAGVDNHDGAVGNAFANIYFSSFYPTTNGSNVGFEISNDRAFNPGVAGYFPGLNSVGVRYAVTQPTTYTAGGGKGVYEFAIPFSFFTNDPLNMGFQKSTVTDSVQFRSIQAFGYNFVGSDTFGPERFGVAPVPASVPEPATMAALGLGALGLLKRRKRAAK